jgi:hypothetical protein
LIINIFIIIQNTYIVNGKDIILSFCEIFDPSLNVYLCFGLFNKFYILSSLSSLLFSDKSGILELGIIVNGAYDSVFKDLIALGDNAFIILSFLH